jgi:hypothetical protein
MPHFDIHLWSALAPLLCWQAHVDFAGRPQVETTIFFAASDEGGRQFLDRKGIVFTPQAEVDDLTDVYSSQLTDANWRCHRQKGSSLVVIEGSAKDPIAKVEFTSPQGWTPKVTMKPVLRATPPKADDKKDR